MNHSALILLVEDDRSMLDGMYDLFQMTWTLEKAGIDYAIEVMTANNGQEALEIMSQHVPDLIVSDIMMPIMDGHQLLDKVQKNPEWLHIPFIFLTAKGHKKEILEGKLLGATLYITKPFVSNELLELIKIQLDKTFQRQQTHQQDVTELKKGILQVLNHEFRTPLTYVTAYYEMLADSLERFPDTQNFQDYLRGIQAGCVRLTKLIKDFILVIELRTGEYQSKFQQRAKPVATINALVETAIQKRRSLAAEKDIQLNFSPIANLPAVYGDENSLLIAFDHLISNAIKFTFVTSGEKKPINISTSIQDQEIAITFHDNGMGFPNNIRTQIFDLFFQHNRNLMEQQGTGSGLTIAKGLVDLHGGNIKAESQENEGSVFTITLPIYTDSFDQDLSALHGTQTQKEATVLVVEDEENLLLGLKELLLISKDTYHLNVLTASNGQQGLQQLHEQKPDLIVSDIMMPVMDGYTFLDHVRQNPDWGQIPFIFLSAKAEHQDVHRGLRSGAEVYITKPYDSDELVQLIAAQLDRYFQLQGLMSHNFDALKRSILSLITPDFHLPLSAVQEYSKTLAISLSDVQNDVELKNSLHGIQAESIQLTHLVEDFISLAELKTGETETAFALREQPIYNPGHQFCKISHDLLPMAEATGTQLHCEFSDSLPSIYGDHVTLFDGLNRLLKLSIKSCVAYSEQKVLLKTDREADKIYFSIELPAKLKADYLENILAITVNTESDISELTNSAPSLSIAKSYIELNNGRIQILKEPGQSYTITISLPVYTPPESIASP